MTRNAVLAKMPIWGILHSRMSSTQLPAGLLTSFDNLAVGKERLAWYAVFFSLIISDIRTGTANLNFKIFKVCFKFGHFNRKPNLIIFF